jgi:hypothetical protein
LYGLRVAYAGEPATAAGTDTVIKAGPKTQKASMLVEVAGTTAIPRVVKEAAADYVMGVNIPESPEDSYIGGSSEAGVRLAVPSASNVQIIR